MVFYNFCRHGRELWNPVHSHQSSCTCSSLRTESNAVYDAVSWISSVPAGECQDCTVKFITLSPLVWIIVCAHNGVIWCYIACVSPVAPCIGQWILSNGTLRFNIMFTIPS
jgi:hypothetical protein